MSYRIAALVTSAGLSQQLTDRLGGWQGVGKQHKARSKMAHGGHGRGAFSPWVSIPPVERPEVLLEVSVDVPTPLARTRHELPR